MKRMFYCVIFAISGFCGMLDVAFCQNKIEKSDTLDNNFGKIAHHLIDNIISILSSKNQYSQKQLEIREIIRQKFDIESISNTVFGQRNLNNYTQRSSLVNSYIDYVVNTYLSIINKANTKDYVVKITKISFKNDIVMVDSEISYTADDQKKSSIQLTWVMNAKTTKILDVIIERASMIHSHKNEFAGVIRSGGLDKINKLITTRVLNESQKNK